ncbi:uncharacterized protein LDX57_006225 [Aspergillus melleus]|uniref:uncharacterized protein n=1 Tax=Aspergillus melleus TaxID=138277 RepID=UPI001E8E16A1|nr:uncharacterized protein LDX57_006225 [Aspergillus melleus]KAH8428529.1 hypothetical protein LDX57_006225 [Aspergillus melleus]
MARAAVIPKSSPPKRATRTTAKRTTTSTTTTTTTSKTTKPAPTKSATRTTTKGKAPTSATEARKRGVRTAAAASNPVEDSSDDGTDDELGDVDTKPKSSTTRTKAKSSAPTTTTAGRGRRTATTATPEVESDEDEDELAQTEAPKKRAGRPKARSAEPAEKPTAAPKTRGRPKGSGKTNATTGKEGTQRKTRTQTSVEPELEAESGVEQAPKEIFITTNSSSMRSNILRGPAKKKKVTFRDPDSEEDMSEPIPPPAGRRRAATPAKKGGLAAKPVRNSPAASGRGRKPAAAKKGTSKPLSPKKATQVAKSISSYASSDGEEDELSVAKSPVRITVDSPTKHGSTKTGLSSPVKRINFASASPKKKVDENGEPTAHLPMPMDFSESLFMSSPARRPTPSPFNFTMRETPRRGGFTVREDMKASNQQDSTPTKSSPLKASPKKAKLETPRRGNLNFLGDSGPLSQPNFTPGHTSPLKSSPKKGLFSISLPSQPAPPVSSTPLKSMSLLQSPAKRIASPFKSSLMRKSPLAEDRESEDEDHAESYTPTQSPPKHVDFDEMDDIKTEDDDHVDAAEFEEAEGSLPAENRMGTQPETENHAEAEASEVSDDEPEEQPQEYPSDHVDDHDSAIPNAHEDPMDPLELQAQESASEHDFEEENVDSEAGEDNQEEEVEQNVESHNNSHPEDTQPVFESHEEKRESLANGNIENVEDEDEIAHVEEKAHDAEEDKDLVSEQDHETAHLTEPEQAQEDTVEKTPERSIIREEATSTGRRSLIEGLEDVFVDAPLPAGQLTEDLDSMSGDDMSVAGGEEVDMAEPNNQYDEDYYDVGDDYVFDDDEETIVAFEMTGQQQMFDAPDIAHEQPQDTAPRQVEDQAPQSPVESIEQQMTQAPINDENIIQESASREVENRPSSPSLRNVESYREEKDEMDSNADDSSDSEPSAEGSIHATKNASPQVQFQPEHQSPAPATEAPRGNRPRFTLLADQLSGWRASSPQKAEPRRSKRRGVFSLGGGLRRSSGVPRASRLSGQVSYPDITAHEDNLALESSHQENNVEDQNITSHADMMPESEAIQDNAQEIQPSIEQPNFEIFSDPEPEVVHTEAVDETNSSDPVLASSNEDKDSTKPASPAQEASFEYDDNKENDDIPLPGPVTPMKNRSNQLQTVHTVSKVPLKGEGQISPLKVSRKRGLSMGTSPTRSSSRIRKSLGPLSPASLRPPPKLPRLQQDTIPKLQPNTSRRRSSMGQQPRSVAKPSRTSSPAKSSRKSISATNLALQGAVVFVDVHTTEGEDASGIFIELLQQMGARCVKNWSWNPRASVSPDEDAQTKEGRVGITHVVYKDGGVRTLEKVRHARGLVKCVGVGWVLDCEREGKWLDEAHYAVDSSIIPRGGAKRRKSMEPRALSNVNGTLVTSTAAANSRRSGADWNTVEEFKRHTPTPPLEEPSTPTNNRKYDADINERYFQTPKTPGYGFNIDNIGMSPATPYYLSQRNKLVQQTCPPKQLQQGLFERAGPSEQPSQKLRTKLEAARRKSLAYKPRVGSPLIE